MQFDIGSFKPFEQQDYPVKKAILDIARKQPNTFEGKHTKVVIYINAIDFIAGQILENLSIIASLVTRQEFNGVMFFDYDKENKGEPLGIIISQLKKYEFPLKKDFLKKT